MSTYRVTLEGAPEAIRAAVADLVTQAGQEVQNRGYSASTQLKNAANHVLRGERHGRRYKVPGTYRLQMDKVAGKKRHGRYYTASAPGEPPAVRTGMFRARWSQRTRAEDLGGGECNVYGSIVHYQRVNGRLLGEILEEGTRNMAPRPYKQRIIDQALPKVIKIYKKPYFRG